MQAIRGAHAAEDDKRPLFERLSRIVSLGLFVLSMIVTLLTHGGVYPAAISVALLLMVGSLLIGYFGQSMVSGSGYIRPAVLGSGCLNDPASR